MSEFVFQDLLPLGADDRAEVLFSAGDPEPDDPAQVGPVGQAEGGIAQQFSVAGQRFWGNAAVAEGKGGVSSEFDEHVSPTTRPGASGRCRDPGRPAP